MTFTVGETVVHPHHGAALIEEIRTRTFRGEEKLYLKLKLVNAGDMTIELPVEMIEEVGVREPIGPAELERLFEVLRAPVVEELSNWSRRYKANREKLSSGDIIRVAEVVRDLSLRRTTGSLSGAEKQLLAEARQILVSELALAEATGPEQAEAMLDDVLSGGPTQ